jgi:hypothetical protein
MANKTENPRAFPVAIEGFVQNGMTLRDYFAGQAFSSAYEYCQDNNGDVSPSRIASWAYSYADAMLAER